MKLNVYLNMFGKRELLGLLYEEKQRIFFEYAADFLKSKIELSPFKLPLKHGVFENDKCSFDGLFGLFNDSLPDGWGCLLLDRKLRQKGVSYDGITPLSRLSLIGRNPMGALEYEPADDLADNLGDVQLDSLSSEVDKILDGHDSEILDELLKLNGSSGGARPKIVAMVSADRKQIIHGGVELPKDFSPWIIKFTERKDGNNFGEVEYRYSLAAKEAGIDIPPTHLFPSKHCAGYFGVQRFDRVGTQKIHIHSACGLLHASHRISSLDYENLLKLTLILTRDNVQVKEMVRRMIFNVKSGNRDDHSKNFAFMLNNNHQWQLAPAYDLTPSAGINGEQTAMVNGKGKNITDADLIATASTVGISVNLTKEMIDCVNNAIDEYKLLKLFPILKALD